jgi:hypothetical protein
MCLIKPEKCLAKRTSTSQNSEEGFVMYPNRTVTERTASGSSQSYHSRRMIRWEWSPAQLVGFAVGLVFVVLGGVAVARTGIDFQHLTLKHVQVAGAGHTQLLGYIEIGFGILMLAAASVPDAALGLMSFLGLAALAFGLVVAIQPSSFNHALGVTGGGYGIFLAIVGAVTVIAACISPVFWRSSHWSSTAAEPRV